MATDVLYYLSHGAKGIAKAFHDKYSGNVIVKQEIRRERMSVVDGIMDINWSPDGKYIATADRVNNVTIWNPRTGEKIYELLKKHKEYVSCVRFSPDGKFVATGSHDGTCKVWSLGDKKLKKIHDYKHGEEVHTLCWSPTGDRLAVGGYNVSVGSEPIKIWNLHIRRIVMKMIHDLHDVYCLRWQPANDFSLWETIASSSCAGNTLKLWRVKHGDCLHTFVHDDYVTDFVWAPDASRIVTACHDWSITIWDVIDGLCILQMYHDHWALSVAWSHDMTRIASGGADMSLQVWNAETGDLIRKKQYPFQINTVEFSPDDEVIAFSSRYSTEKLAKPWRSRVHLQKAPAMVYHDENEIEKAPSYNSNSISSRGSTAKTSLTGGTMSRPGTVGSNKKITSP